MEAEEGPMLEEMMQGAGISSSEFNKFHNRNLTARQKALWMVAAKEEGIKTDKVSVWGNMIPKIPRSWVENMKTLQANKIHNYCFSGSFLSKDLPNRRWLADFIKSHFTEGDYFKATDANKNAYTPLGLYDATLKDVQGFRPKSCGGKCWKFETTYWQNMAQSKFTLCPGGDAPFSYRFYETFLARTIPVIHSLETDWNQKGPAQVGTIDTIRYEYMTTESHEYDAEVAERNYAKFIKYQTFMEGDNVPPGAEARIHESIGHH